MTEHEVYRQFRIALLTERNKLVKHIEGIFSGLLDRFSEDEIRKEKEAIGISANGKKKPTLFVDSIEELKEEIKK